MDYPALKIQFSVIANSVIANQIITNDLSDQTTAYAVGDDASLIGEF